MKPPEGHGPPDPGGITAAAPPQTLFLLGVPIHNLTERETLDRILLSVKERRPCHIVTSNLDFLLQAWRDPEMNRIHLEADLVLADGMPLVWFSRFFGPALKERVAGSDLIPKLAEAARDHGMSFYAIGGAPGVAERAMRLLQERYPGLKVAGWESPPMAPLLQMDHEGVVARVRAAKPDIILVAFGAPKQEKYIRLNAPEWDVPVAIGVGASLDFLVGTQVRAPKPLQRIGMEWFWRMVRDPRRMAKRYGRDFLFLFGMLGRLVYLRFMPADGLRRGPRPDPAAVQAAGARWIRFRRLLRPEPAETFCRETLPAVAAGPVVLDLSIAPWLNSMELGALARLARACRDAGRQLLLAHAHPRVARLIRSARMDRYLQVFESGEALLREVHRQRSSSQARATRFNQVDNRLQILLPAEFGRETVAHAREEFLRRWKTGTLREVVIDARGMRYIDISGARFLLASRRLVEREQGCSLWLLGFPQSSLETMRKEGLDSYKVDRRKTFRRDEFPPSLLK